jgi:hypothetical protein
MDERPASHALPPSRRLQRIRAEMDCRLPLHKYVLYNILTIRHTVRVKWKVEFHRDFDPEFDALPDDVQGELGAHALRRKI